MCVPLYVSVATLLLRPCQRCPHTFLSALLMAPKMRKQCLPKAGLIKRLNAVGASIEADTHNKMLGEIIEHLKKNPDQLEPCHRLCVSGMVKHVGAAREVGKHIPECTTKLGLVSQGLKKRTLKHLMPSLDMTTQAKMKNHDKNYHEKLFFFALAETPDTPVTDSTEEGFFETVTRRYQVCGNRLENIRIQENGRLDWNQGGVYQLVAGGGGFTHVKHVASGVQAYICRATR
jgi:hypothetical protein